MRCLILTPFSIRLAWGQSSDSDGDHLSYAVCLRKRIEGVAQPWSPARETERPAIAWHELSPETVYDVRVRAWDGKAASDWYLKEHAFVTPSVRRLSSYRSRADMTAPDGQPVMLVVWPDDSNAEILESSDAVGNWIQCLEVETDGTHNRALLPIDTGSRFFKVR